MTTIFIKGLGLIGSSLARAFKEQSSDCSIIGSDIRTDNLIYAKKCGIINHASEAWQGVEKADFVFLASPVEQICQDLRDLAQLKLKQNVIVTDVGSVKQTVMDAAKPLLDCGVTFIGGHPMAGSHKTGVQAGKANLFENAFYLLVTPATVYPQQLQKLSDLLSSTKAQLIPVTAQKHDWMVAQISHVPHVLAATLMNQTQATFAQDSLGMRAVAGGFKSMTRIAAASPTMWTSILCNNTTEILKQLADFQEDLTKVQLLIENKQQEKIYNFFATAKAQRNQLDLENPNNSAPYYDLFVNILDQVGAIAHVTTKIAQANISLVNLQILEIREDIDGVLQLTFGTSADHKLAKKILEKEYEIIF